MVSHGHAEGAWQYFNQMLSKYTINYNTRFTRDTFLLLLSSGSGIQPNLDTYNSMLRIAGVVKESADLKVQFIQVEKQ